MGFFSWNCPECGHSIMNPYGPKEEGLNDCTLVHPKTGDVIAEGSYDGYGRIDCGFGQFEIDWQKDVSLYHQGCWKKRDKSKPVEISKNASGQGHFYDDGGDEVP